MCLKYLLIREQWLNFSSVLKRRLSFMKKFSFYFNYWNLEINPYNFYMKLEIRSIESEWELAKKLIYGIHGTQLSILNYYLRRYEFINRTLTLS